MGVLRSLPAAAEKRRKSAVATTHTVCDPRSSGDVLQQPSRKNPVIGLIEHGASGPPRTLRDGARPPHGRPSPLLMSRIDSSCLRVRIGDQTLDRGSKDARRRSAAALFRVAAATIGGAAPLLECQIVNRLRQMFTDWI